MTYITANFISAAAAKDARIDSSVEFDEPGKALVWLADGYTWNAQDGNRSVEGFIIGARNSDQAQRDTVAYWKECVANITVIQE